MTVREDRVQWPDGSVGTYGVVDKPDFVIVVPRAEDGFWLVEQYRYAIGRRAWEFPQGSWSGEPLGDQYALARLELAEETGLISGDLRHLGHIYEAYGFCSQGGDVFLARKLTAGRPRREPTEQDMVHRFVTDGEFDTMARAGEIVDAGTLAAHALYLMQVHERGAGRS